MGFKCTVCGKEQDSEFDLTRGICDKCLFKKLSFSLFILYIADRLEDFFEFWVTGLKVEECEDDFKAFILKQLYDKFILEYHFAGMADRKYIDECIKDYVRETLDDWAAFLLEEGTYDNE